MDNPVSVGTTGAKIKPDLMKPDKLYHCVFNDKVLLFFKDEQDFLNCYEIEESSLVSKIKSCKDDSELEKVLEDYIQKENLNN